MNEYLTWEMLKDYATLVGVIFTVVAATKNLPLIQKIPTRIWSMIVSFILMLAINLQGNTFKPWDLLLYVMQAIIISVSANGISDINSLPNTGNVIDLRENKGEIDLRENKEEIDLRENKEETVE